MFETQLAACDQLGLPHWRDLLRYVVKLRQRSIQPALERFVHPWEEIGPGYCYRPAFGHWDIVHAAFDSIDTEPDHARRQLQNYFAWQRPDGSLPCVLRVAEGRITCHPTATHPPVWPLAVDALHAAAPDHAFLQQAYAVGVAQLDWFNQQRRVVDSPGFYYLDVLQDTWESGIDEGLRFDRRPPCPRACVDATAQVYGLCDALARWATMLGQDAARWRAQADALRQFIQAELFDPKTNFFHDHWWIGRAQERALAFEGFWPLIVGAASPTQARAVIECNLLNPARFFAPHPIATVALSDPRFELRLWRGPTWNSMTHWAARGCVRNGQRAAARQLLEHALNATADVFARTGTIWEFYDPRGGDPQLVKRKPSTPFNQPCTDYLGHNPLLAMAHLWQRCQ